MFEAFPILKVPGNDGGFVDKVFQRLVSSQGGNQRVTNFVIETTDVIRLCEMRIGRSELEDEHFEVCGVFTNRVRPLLDFSKALDDIICTMGDEELVPEGLEEIVESRRVDVRIVVAIPSF